MIDLLHVVHSRIDPHIKMFSVDENLKTLNHARLSTDVPW